MRSSSFIHRPASDPLRHSLILPKPVAKEVAELLIQYSREPNEYELVLPNSTRRRFFSIHYRHTWMARWNCKRNGSLSQLRPPVSFLSRWQWQ
jgi:hypothetical protein